MKDYCRYVDVFQGVDEIDEYQPKGVASAWKFIKGLCGNNTPAAALPFGRITACCYSGGYSSGYGRLMKNSHGKIGHLFETNMFKGIAHLQNDGTGDIDTFYNYALVSPFHGELTHADDPRPFTDENGCPGYYTCTDTLTGAKCEVTVTRRVALHRYTFLDAGEKIRVDFSNDGLYEDGQHNRFPAGACELKIESDNSVSAKVCLHNVDIHFFIRYSGGSAPKLWADGKIIGEKTLSLPEGHTFGCVFDASQTVEITMGLSPFSAETAQKDALENHYSFDEAKEAAASLWNETLSRLDVSFDNETDTRIFYSNLYHSLLKPCDWSGESYLYKDKPFVTEFATIWDQYKTALPLIFTLYPEMSEKITGTILAYAEATKQMPHTLMFYNVDACTTQARMLAEHSLYDAHVRGVKFDVQRAMRLSYEDCFVNHSFDSYVKDAGKALHKAFIIDITDACDACARMAKEAGLDDLEISFREVANLWMNVFDPATGLLRDGERFYEGSKWNYSFRLMHDMKKRVELAGGKKAFAALADRFFGFTDPESLDCSFEGFNNETDMESPYVYHYCGRHDRLSEIIDGALTYLFTTGRGGVPGNNDSSGLCSCYVWNAVGIFPVSGQDEMIIGSPRSEKAEFALANGKCFTVQKEGKGIYVERAYLDGEELKTLSFPASRMMQGGTLKLIMSEEPVIR